MSESVTPSHEPYRYRLQDLPGPRPLPLLGNMHQIKTSQFHLGMARWAQEYGTAYQIHIAGKRCMVLSDPAYYAALLRDRPDGFRRSSNVERIVEEGGVRGLFTAGGDDWRKQRKLVMRAFTPEVVRRFFPQLQSMTERLRQHWLGKAQRGEPIDLLRELKSFALDITVALAYGQDINSVAHPDNPLPRDIESMFSVTARRMTSPIKYWRYIRLPQDYAAEATLLRIGRTVDGFIAQTRQLLQQEPERRQKPSNLLEALVSARDEPDSGFDDSHVSGNAITMVFAGEDTTANSTAWLVNFLANAPQTTQKIRAELDALFPHSGILPDYAMLQQLPMLDAALNESMRLKPVAPFVGLESLREMVVAGVLLPPQTPVLLLLRAAGMQAQHFPEPERFWPERWLNGAEPELIKKMLPFGGGPRLCPGRFLALSEMKMIVSMLVKNFEIQVQPGVKVEEVFSFTMTPSCLPVLLTPRI